MPRSAVSQVCMWALTRPGMTILSEASITSSALAPRCGHGLDGVAVVKKVTALDLADLGVERHQPAALDENALQSHPFP